jgi:hypothetical protein
MVTARSRVWILAVAGLTADCATTDPDGGIARAGGSIVISTDSVAYNAVARGQVVGFGIRAWIFNGMRRPVYLSSCAGPDGSALSGLEKQEGTVWRVGYSIPCLGPPASARELGPGATYIDSASIVGIAGRPFEGFHTDPIAGTYRAIYMIYSTRQAAEDLDARQLLPRPSLTSNPFAIELAR